MDSTRSTPWYAHLTTELKAVSFRYEIGYHGKLKKNAPRPQEMDLRIPRAQGAVREGGVEDLQHRNQVLDSSSKTNLFHPRSTSFTHDQRRDS